MRFDKFNKEKDVIPFLFVTSLSALVQLSIVILAVINDPDSGIAHHLTPAMTILVPIALGTALFSRIGKYEWTKFASCIALASMAQVVALAVIVAMEDAAVLTMPAGVSSHELFMRAMGAWIGFLLTRLLLSAIKRFFCLKD